LFDSFFFSLCHLTFSAISSLQFRPYRTRWCAIHMCWIVSSNHSRRQSRSASLRKSCSGRLTSMSYA
jgi:hypothetical protein